VVFVLFGGAIVRQFVLPTLAGLVAAVVVTLCVQWLLYASFGDGLGLAGPAFEVAAAACGLLAGLGAGLTTWVVVRGGREAATK
jgi:hypothetical protein